VVSFVIAYGTVAWLLRFVAGHSIGRFVPYRVALGVVLLVVLGAGWMTAT
jgi:undecaprenyl-diphosphatase